MFAIKLLGPFELADCRAPIVLPVTARRLVALLALEGRPIARTRAAGLLWPDKPEARAAANLRSTLWRLNGAVEGLVDGQGGELALTCGTSVDIDAFRPNTGPSPSPGNGPLDTVAGDRAPTSISPTTAAVVGAPPNHVDLLIDWDDEWVVAEREPIRQLVLRALETAAAELAAARLFPEAASAGLTAVRLAPLRESAHRALIGVHLDEGNYSEAVRQYRAFESASLEAFGIGPSLGLARLLGGFESAA